MKIIKYIEAGSGVEVLLDEGHFFIQGITDDIIRCVYTKEAVLSRQSPLGICPGSLVRLKVSESEAAVVLKTHKIMLSINKKDGIFEWKNAVTGKLLLKEGGKQLVQTPVEKYEVDGEKPVITRRLTPDGERNFIENLKKYTDRMAYRGKLFFNWDADEVIHGLGQGEEGIYDYRHANQYLYQHNMRIPIPFFVSDRNYGILADCGSLMTFNDDARGSYLFMDTVEQLDYYVIHGESLDDIVTGFRHLTGAAVMLPRWAFGYVQSKEAYRNQQELVETVQEYRRRKIPLDCIVQDWNTWKDGAWGNKIVDKKRYPDLKKAMDEIHAMHVHTMVSIWPNMNAGCENYNEFLESGHLLNDYATYDAFSEEARRIYWDQTNEELFSGGFDSWWCDSTEPFSGADWSGEELLEPWERYHVVGMEHKKYLDAAKANLYAVVHARGIYENQRAAAPQKRVLNLTRSGYATSQCYGTVLWSGDTCATWDNFKKQITEGLNFCMSGMPYWTLDIGAFFVVKDNWQARGCNCNQDSKPRWFWKGDYEEGAADNAYRELYVRWFQYGTFLPMFRSHGTDTPREVWNFGEPGEAFYDALIRFIYIRYRLMPYIYALAGLTYTQHATMHRSMMFDFADDPAAKKLDTQFMLGSSILVSPVTAPMYYEKGNQKINRLKQWRCYLPQAHGWYDYWEGTYYSGGENVTVNAGIDRIPVFIKAGAIIPMEAGLTYADEAVDTPLEIHIYPGCDGNFIFYEDAGEGYDYEKGIYNEISMHWDDENRIFRVGEAHYAFPGGMKDRQCRLVMGSREKDFVYYGEAMEIAL